MEVRNQRIAKNTTYLYIRMLINMGINLYVSRVILDVLGVDDYGIYNVVGGFVSMLAIFTSTITSAAQRFITFELGAGDKKKLQQTFATIVCVILLLAAIIFIVGEIFGLFFIDRFLVIPDGRMAAAIVVFHCSVIAFVINLISIPYTAAVIAHENMNFFAIISILESVFKLIVVLSIAHLRFDRLCSYAVLLVVVAVLVRMIYWAYCKHYFEETTGRLVLDKNIFKNVFSYSVWVSIGASSSILKEQGVNVLINMFCGVAMNAARGVSMQVYSLANTFSGNLSQAIAPQITKSYAAGDTKRAISLTVFMTKVQGILSILIIVPLFVEAEYVLNLWLKEVPYYAVTFTRYALLLCLARTLEGSHGPLFLATGKVKKIQLIGGGLMLLNLPLSYLFLHLGYEPACTMIIGIIMEMVVMFVVYYMLKQMLEFPIKEYYIKVVIPIVLLLIISIIIPLYIKNLITESFGRLVLVTSTSIILITILSLIMLFTKTERISLFNLINRKK